MIHALLLTALFCADFDNDIAIAIAINQPVAQEQSVVTPEAKPPAVPVQKFTTRKETRYRTVKRCFGGYCKWVREPYTVTVRVPVESAATKSWPRYPTTNKSIYRLNNGHGAHADWKHLTQGQHSGKFNADWLRTLSQAEIEALHADDHTNKVQWAYVVRP